MDCLPVIEPYEAALRTVMLANDVEALAPLLDDDLVFTAPDGQVLSKGDDLSAHRAKLLRLERLDLHETRAHAVGEMILTTTKAVLAGEFAGAPIDGTFAYTRLWRRSGARWRIVAGHAAKVA
ncbi:nuclear transport factor 2 family protein [Ralstonia solanacearum]|uniref:nuclear transport factor 2 family protein n=1 Tax=Ralstonia solanacearum TaxID=305 RepID=UPI00018167A6|nr:nuclear transport factor 2 family protein [Ralstonia solanacearum]MDC6175987.1 nuclear transport factor 2 family protein [Ralstonia solanacearum]MDC6209628.1 nuclear transport factor 2 family protein [Ralstonia solanacearum]MDC6239522.1 nuclear transport factor 2 family protein [Ralstonia solanacearum]MDD7799402.1 nuclear transport factor 2 family protein [Ralstonia solanacearum]TYZ53245.1 nuclear transport factor 2 family protein [Ralstonia solanacearum]